MEVPDVKGISVELAEPFFTQRKLNYTVVDSIFVREAVPGSIFETIPPVGSMVKEGRTIYLKVNSFMPQLITLPEVKDNSLRQSMAMLRALGFEKIDTKNVPGVHRELVLGIESRGTTLEAGQRVTANTPLTLLVSSGSGDFFMFEGPEDSVDVSSVESWD